MDNHGAAQKKGSSCGRFQSIGTEFSCSEMSALQLVHFHHFESYTFAGYIEHAKASVCYDDASVLKNIITEVRT